MGFSASARLVYGRIVYSEPEREGLEFLHRMVEEGDPSDELEGLGDFFWERLRGTPLDYTDAGYHELPTWVVYVRDAEAHAGDWTPEALGQHPLPYLDPSVVVNCKRLFRHLFGCEFEPQWLLLPEYG